MHTMAVGSTERPGALADQQPNKQWVSYVLVGSSKSAERIKQLRVLAHNEFQFKWAASWRTDRLNWQSSTLFICLANLQTRVLPQVPEALNQL